MDKFGLLWFVVASLVVLWDALFVLLRPRTLPGGDLHHFFKPYSLYIEIDKKYGDVADTFVYAQSWANVVEVILNFSTVTLLLLWNKKAWLCGFLVSTMTFWKTVIYLIQYSEICGGGHMLQHVTWPQYLGLFLVPNGIWILVPLYFMVAYGKILQTGLDSMNSPKPKSH